MSLRNCLAYGVVLLIAGGTAAIAQGHVMGGLRISDETGAPVGVLPSPPGEKYYHLDSGTKTFYVAFDFTGTSPVDIELRVLGPMGTVLYKHTDTYSEPGVQIVKVSSDVPWEDNEYVVNAYVGPEWYLADSLQLAVGAAEIPGSKAEASVAPVAAQATMVPVQSSPASTSSPVPGGPSRGVLVAAGALLVLLVAIVVWATATALRAR